VNLGPGVYWLEIYNNTGFGTDDWFWETGNLDPVNGIPGSAFAFSTPGAGWNPLGDDLSMQIIAGGEVVPCDSLSDIPWLSLNPAAGSTGPGGTTTVDVTFDSTGLAAGTYTGNLCVYSNDPDPGPGNGTDLVVVPVELVVEEQVDVPDIFVDPLAIASTQNTNTVTNWPLDVENVGTADLNWNIDEDNSLAGPISGGVVPPANQVTAGDMNFSGSGLTGATVTPERETPAGLVTITHSATQNIVSGNSVSCNDGFGHTDNSYLRVFDLESFGIFGPFDVVEVEIGIEAAFTAGGSQPATMNLYLWDEGDPFTFANFNLIGSANTTVFDSDAGTIITVPVAGSAPAGSNLVVEFFTPNGQAAGNLLWVGSNPDGQTSPTYLAAADCGVPEPTDTAALGFPGMHMVMNVTGDTDAGPATCDAPDDIPWASVAPDNGTTVPGDTDTVTVTFDSTGLAAGTYVAALCVTSNDPDPGPGNGTDLVVVDLELTVEQPTDVGLSGISGDTSTAMLPLMLSLLAVLAVGFGLIARRRSLTK
jgi:hypothetical protein